MCSVSWWQEDATWWREFTGFPLIHLRFLTLKNAEARTGGIAQLVLGKGSVPSNNQPTNKCTNRMWGPERVRWVRTCCRLWGQCSCHAACGIGKDQEHTWEASTESSCLSSCLLTESVLITNFVKALSLRVLQKEKSYSPLSAPDPRFLLFLWKLHYHSEQQPKASPSSPHLSPRWMDFVRSRILSPSDDIRLRGSCKS